jgi:hypothetical protein
MRFSSSLWIFLSVCLLDTQALGGSNVFGLFRKRLLQLEQIQQKREARAALMGFAGAHGAPLSGKDLVAEVVAVEAVDTTSHEEEESWSRGWFHR